MSLFTIRGNLYILQNFDTTITGWVHHAGNAVQGGGQDMLLNPAAAVGFAAFDGTQAVLFGGTSTTGGSLSQTFDTVAGTQYTIGYYRAVVQCDSTCTPPQTVILSAFNALDSNQLGSESDTFVDRVWTSGSLSFVAGSTSSTIVFTDATPQANSGPVNWVLDGVTVVGQASAAPEPGTWSLMSGVLLAGFGMLRRRR
jgi:hypothetical protein